MHLDKLSKHCAKCATSYWKVEQQFSSFWHNFPISRNLCTKTTHQLLFCFHKTLGVKFMKENNTIFFAHKCFAISNLHAPINLKFILHLPQCKMQMRRSFQNCIYVRTNFSCGQQKKNSCSGCCPYGTVGLRYVQLQLERGATSLSLSKHRAKCVISYCKVEQ